MSTRKKSASRRRLEKLAGGPLTLGMVIRSTRLGEEMTQAGFARLLGVTPSYLCDLEKDRKSVSPARAARFAKALGYSERQYVRLALQDALRRAGLSYTVEIHGR
jgi:transcriptional regulator with XRE-family HTH domain